MFILNDGTRVTYYQITEAFSEGKARIIYGHGETCTTAGLMLDGIDRDTRGQCYSILDEVWTAVPATARDALHIAYSRI